MDEKTAERISQLAKNLKDLHLAASTEEAYARAKEIVLGAPMQGTEQSVRELMEQSGVSQKDLEKAKELLKDEEQALRELKKELTELKAKHIEKDLHHAVHSKDVEDLDSELAQADHDVGLVEENVEVAEKIQDEDS